MTEKKKKIKVSPDRISLERRCFLQRFGRISIGLVLSGTALNAFGGTSDPPPFQTPGFTRPSLPNACVNPRTDSELTLAAVIDTVVPGPETDPEGAPGGLEACAMNLLLDDYYPFKNLIDSLAGLIDAKAMPHGGPFVELGYEARVKVIQETQEALPMLKLAFRAIRSAFYGGAYNGVGLEYLGYPGPNLGYSHIRDASFRRPVCRELSETGWMP